MWTHKWKIKLQLLRYLDFIKDSTEVEHGGAVIWAQKKRNLHKPWYKNTEK